MNETKYPEVSQILAHPRRAKITLLLDENIEQLAPAFEDAGFKVFTVDKGLSDDAIKKRSEGWVIVTKNSRHFTNDAVKFDYDVVSIEALKFIDPKTDRTNQTVTKVANAIRDSGFYNVKGNFNLKIRDDGTFDLVPLV